MTKEPLILIGGGGHCKSCIDVIESEDKYSIEGILDLAEKKGETISGYSIVGTDDDIDMYINKRYFFLITIGQIKSAIIRKRIYTKLVNGNARLATVISSKAYVSGRSQVGAGTIVMHGALINTGASVGENCIINTGSNIEHDVMVGNHCHLSTRVVINGDCKIADNVFIGSNSTILNGVTIGEGIVVGGGTVVIQSISDAGVYVGVPARKIK